MLLQRQKSRSEFLVKMHLNLYANDIISVSRSVIGPVLLAIISLIFPRTFLQELFTLLQIDLVYSVQVLPGTFYVGIDENIEICQTVAMANVVIDQRNNVACVHRNDLVPVIKDTRGF